MKMQDQIDQKLLTFSLATEEKNRAGLLKSQLWQDYEFFNPADVDDSKDMDNLIYFEGQGQQIDPNDFQLLLEKPPSLEAFWDTKLQDFCKKQQTDFFYPQDGQLTQEDQEEKDRPENEQFDLPYPLTLKTVISMAQMQETQVQSPVSIKHRKIQKHQKIQAFHSLAQRNMRLNMGTAMTHFLAFLGNRASFSGNHKQAGKYQALLKWLNKNQNYFRSFEGWQALWKGHSQSHFFRKMCFRFFNESFAESYILNGKVKHDYKTEYMKKIKKFKIGSVRPSTFTSRFFKANDQEQTS